MPWQIAIAISLVASIATTLVRRHYSQKSNVPAMFPAAASYVFGVLPIGLVAGFLIFPHAIHWSWWLVMLLALEGCAMAIAVSTTFHVAGRLGVAPNQTISQVKSVVVILLGWTILGEGLTKYQLIGGAVLLVAALLAVWAPAKNTTAGAREVHASAVILAVVAAVTMSIGLVTEKAVLGHMQIGGNFLVGWTTQALVMTLLTTRYMNRENLQKFRGREFKWSALMGACNGLTGVFYVYAIVHSNNISLITALLAAGLPLTVFGAYLFLNEREHHKIMWASLGVSFVGLLVTGIK